MGGELCIIFRELDGRKRNSSVRRKYETIWYLFLGEVYFELSADKICRATAQMLLQNAVKFNLAEFQEVWQQSVPEGMTTRLDQLKVRERW